MIKPSFPDNYYPELYFINKKNKTLYDVISFGNTQNAHAHKYIYSHDIYIKKKSNKYH